MNALYQEHPKHVARLLAPLSENVVHYPPNVLTYKEKSEKAIVKASAAYSDGYEMLPILKNIDVSYLLGGNEVIVNVFIEECGKVAGAIEFYLDNAEKAAKGCAEVTQYYKDHRALYKKKDLVGAMLSDLMHWDQTLDLKSTDHPLFITVEGVDHKVFDKKTVISMFDAARTAQIKKLTDQKTG